MILTIKPNLQDRARRALLLSLALCATSLVALPACGSPSATPSAPPGWTAFGEGVSLGTPLGLSDLLSAPSAFDATAVLVEGRIEEVCQSKGCWMTFVDGEQSVRVTFRDYGFFVPMDIAGRTVRVKGTFEVRQVPADEVKHYLEDAGRHEEAEAVTGSQLGYRIVADGVWVADD